MLREFANRSIAKGAGPWGRSCWNSTGAGTLADDCLVLTNGKFRKQKIRLGQAGLSPENWLVVKQKQNGELVILHKHTDTIRVVPPLGQ